MTFAGLVEVMQGFSRYWFEIVELPARVTRGRQWKGVIRVTRRVTSSRWDPTRFAAAALN